MGYVKLNYKRPTPEFTDYIKEKLKEVFINEDIGGIKATNVSYEAWNDSDQPGIDERIEFTFKNRKFEAAITHNRWLHFKEIIS